MLPVGVTFIAAISKGARDLSRSGAASNDVLRPATIELIRQYVRDNPFAAAKCQ